MVSIILHLVLILWCGWLPGGMRDTEVGMTPRLRGEGRGGALRKQCVATSLDKPQQGLLVDKGKPVGF